MKVWRLVVWGVAPEHAGLMVHLRLLPSKKNVAVFWREYPIDERGQIVSAIETLRSAGLHGVGKKAEKRDPPKSSRPPSPACSREGFGGKLNARPISGAWRRKTHRA